MTCSGSVPGRQDSIAMARGSSGKPAPPSSCHDETQISYELSGATTGELRLAEFHSSADGLIMEVANPNVIPPTRVWYVGPYSHNVFAPDTDITSLFQNPLPRPA